MPLTRAAFGACQMSVDHVDLLCRANTPARAEVFAIGKQEDHVDRRWSFFEGAHQVEQDGHSARAVVGS